MPYSRDLMRTSVWLGAQCCNEQRLRPRHEGGGGELGRWRRERGWGKGRESGSGRWVEDDAVSEALAGAWSTSSQQPAGHRQGGPFSGCTQGPRPSASAGARVVHYRSLQVITGGGYPLMCCENSAVCSLGGGGGSMECRLSPSPSPSLSLPLPALCGDGWS